jgi:hypothetical protein
MAMKTVKSTIVRGRNWWNDQGRYRGRRNVSVAARSRVARVVAQRLSRTMGQQFIVENKPGGGSTVAVRRNGA